MPDITLALPISNDTVSSDTPSGTDRTAHSDTNSQVVTTTADVSFDKTDKVEPTVNLKQWAKTSAEAREYKAKAAELQAKVDELSKVNPDDESALQVKLLELLKSPGTAKRLITDGGRTFDDIVAELTDIPVDDPVVTAQNKRLEALEQSRKDEQAKLDKDRQAEQAKSDLSAVEQGRKEVSAYASKNDETIQDDKDARNGTLRWAVVSERPDLIETARSEVVGYIAAHSKDRPNGFDTTAIQALVDQALDQLELIERKKLQPLLSKLSGHVTRPIVKTQETSESRFTRTENPFEAPHKNTTPSTITESLRGPMPTKVAKERYGSGPRQIRYTD